MNEVINIMFDENGIAKEYDDTFDISIHCESEEEQNKVLEILNRRWIPVSERLPEKLKDVLVTFYDCPDEYDVAYIRTTFNETYKKNGAKHEWVSAMGETTYADYEVDAWMPIEPYKPESEGKE